MREIEFALRNMIEFTNPEIGDLDKIGTITLSAPTAKDSKAYFRLRGMVSQCAIEMGKYAKGGEANPSAEITRKDVMMMLSVGSGEDLDALVGNFVILAKRVGRLMDNAPLTDYHIDQLEPDEILEMMSEYVAFFIMPSFR